MNANASIRETLTLLAAQPAAPGGVGYRAVLGFIAASDEIRKALRSQLARDGLTVEGFQALAALQQEPVPATPSVLAHKIGTSRALLSHTLNRLEFSGLLARQRDVTDRRVVWVRLTALGLETIKKASVTCNQAILQLVSRFDDDALTELTKSCAKLSQCATQLI